MISFGISSFKYCLSIRLLREVGCMGFTYFEELKWKIFFPQNVLSHRFLCFSSFFFFKDEMNFIVVNRVEDVLRAAFDDESPGMAQAISSKL